MPEFDAPRGGPKGKSVLTSEFVVYSDEELEFLKAVERWKKEHGRKFPTCCDYLAIAKSLGYRKTM